MSAAEPDLQAVRPAQAPPLQRYLQEQPHQLWRASELGRLAVDAPVRSTGFADLDTVLPGGGWPLRAVTEVLQPQAGALEWRLLGPAVCASAGLVLLIAPPHTPFAPGLAQLGLPASRVVWVRPGRPAHAAWATEQALQCHGLGAVLAWLPQLRPEQMRRLQSHASGFAGLCCVFRLDAAQHESSAAPLRVLATLGDAGQVQVRVLKRRGPVHTGCVELSAFPNALKTIEKAALSKLADFSMLQKNVFLPPHSAGHRPAPEMTTPMATPMVTPMATQMVAVAAEVAEATAALA